MSLSVEHILQLEKTSNRRVVHGIAAKYIRFYSYLPDVHNLPSGRTHILAEKP